jgi:uncharacterized membrane protein
MVVRQRNSHTGVNQIIVKGNKSMSWRANVILAASLGAVSSIFGAGIAWVGYWMVLPFAGLEFLVVLYCLGRAYRKLSYMEVLSVSDSTLLIESGHDKPDTRVELPRHWVKVVFDDPASNFDVGKLELQSSGRKLEIGRLLNKEEKRKLHDELLHCLNFEETRLRLIS